MTTQPGSTAEPIAPAPNDQAPQHLPRSRRPWFRYTLPGAWLALLFLCLSFTPTLLPRPAFFQGFVCGINGAIGYGLGVLGAWLWREFADRPARPARRRSWQAFAIVGALALIVCYLLGLRWQNQIRDLMSVPHEGIATQFLLPIVAAAIFVAVIALSRCIRKLYRWVVARLARWMGRRAARGLGWVLVAGAALLVFSGVILDGTISILDRSFSLADTTTSPNARQPTTALRTGGPDSLVAWDTLGFEGRNFAGQGPTQEQIAAFTGAPALPPIRAYAGIASASDVEARAALAVDDLERAGGFDRSYLLVAGTTGTGWVDPGAIDSLEYETGGDVASVAIQYSYLPSWLSFVVDQDRAREAGRAIFEAVYERWSDLPEQTRPKLLLFGVSLGSFSGETAFSGEFDLRNRTDGALFAGPPNFNTLFTEFRDRRDAGSREVEPVFRDGRTARVTGDPSGPIQPVDASWDGTRVLYLAHASDPIVWWSTDLVLGRPDWLTEAPGSDVIDEMVWIPFVTFWQVTADMVEPVSVPQGHGHSYTSQYVDGWAAVIQPDGWTAEKAAELREIIMAEPES
ncbi:MAG: alpha/beta-hydrolase family protein [Nakamurella sp.]